MAKFKLGECSVNLVIEPLSGPLAIADRRLAWRTYLALAMRPALRLEECPKREIEDLVRSLGALLGEWPAAQIESPRPAQLGYLLVGLTEAALIPCLRHDTADSWSAVRTFCQEFAREIAQTYGFPDAGAHLPKDLLAAWERAS